MWRSGLGRRIWMNQMISDYSQQTYMMTHFIWNEEREVTVVG